MAGGRPTKYDPKYCEQVIEFMSQGYSFEAFAGHISVAKDTLYKWAAANQEFSDAKALAFDKSRAFWEKVAVEHIITKDGKALNSSAWIFNMKNRFGWRDKSPEEVKEAKAEVTVNYMPKSERD